MAKTLALPIIDLELYVPTGLTAVRRSQGWPGLFLQERRGHSGSVSYLGGPRQHVLYCFLRPLHSTVSVGGETRPVHYQSGESRFTPATHSVEFSWEGDAQVLVLGLEPWFLQGVAAELGTAPRFSADLNFEKLGAEHPASILLRQLGEELQTSPGLAVMTESLGRAIVVQLLREFSGVRLARSAPAAAPPIAVLRAVELMRQRLSQSLSLEEMAQASGVSPFHFARQFKAATGHPPHEYLMRLRVDHAQELIARQGRSWTLAAIAHESGFADQSHMSRHFRRVLGVTPGEFAEAQRTGQATRRG